MNRDDPDADPAAEAWLLLDEQELIDLVEQYHRTARLERLTAATRRAS
jgi:hypothetical protein